MSQIHHHVFITRQRELLHLAGAVQKRQVSHRRRVDFFAIDSRHARFNRGCIVVVAAKVRLALDEFALARRRVRRVSRRSGEERMTSVASSS